MAFVLSIDGMGGDFAPKVIVEGLFLAWQRHPKVRFLLYGPEPILRPLVEGYQGLSAVITFFHTDEVITANTKPSLAVRSLKNSSMRLALQAVVSEQAHGVVSAGNTGAYFALSKIILKTLAGIDRPAIASQIPTMRGESVMLDLGANITYNAHNLVEFALMGKAFARHVLGIANPKVGLLNIGSESLKGNDSLKEAAQILTSTLEHFHGFIEGDDISKGTVDVIVTDGFTGNIALKTGEGVIRFIFHALRQGLKASWYTSLLAFLITPVFKRLKERFDPRLYNGAVWLGVKGIAVKSHGGTDALGFAYAVGMAIDMIQAKLNHHIAHELDLLPHVEDK